MGYGGSFYSNTLTGYILPCLFWTAPPYQSWIMENYHLWVQLAMPYICGALDPRKVTHLPFLIVWAIEGFVILFCSTHALNFLPIRPHQQFRPLSPIIQSTKSAISAVIEREHSLFMSIEYFVSCVCSRYMFTIFSENILKWTKSWTLNLCAW